MYIPCAAKPTQRIMKLGALLIFLCGLRSREGGLSTDVWAVARLASDLSALRKADLKSDWGERMGLSPQKFGENQHPTPLLLAEMGMDSGLSMPAPFLQSRLHGSHEPRAAAEKVHRGVMHEVPNEDANPTVPALINLGGLNNLLRMQIKEMHEARMAATDGDSRALSNLVILRTYQNMSWR